MNKNAENLSVHMIGVGGAGMSALCKFLLCRGFKVSGSDKVKSDKIIKLENLGLTFYELHDSSNVIDANIVVYSSAIDDSNPELKYARINKITVYKRSELLDLILKCHKSSIGISGSHGKTTATAMVYECLNVAKIPINSFIGGDYGDVVNKNVVAVAEVCEYAKNINDITVDYPACLNVDNDHLDTYGTVENILETFERFLNRGKIAFINLDDKLLGCNKIKKAVTFGITSDCEFKAENLKADSGKYSFDLFENGEFIRNFQLGVVGKHNVYNALCAISIVRRIFKIDYDLIFISLLNFKGVKRRFESVGKLFKKEFVCDYAHHPTEIESALKTANEAFGEDYIVIFQPHTYSRTRLLFKDFLKVFVGSGVVIYKEYPSREEYDYLGSAKRLAKELNADYCETFDELIKKIKRKKASKVIVLGAGDLYDSIKGKIKNG